MLKNHLTLALRTLRRQRGYAVLNIAGLTLGMACCLLIFQYVAYETSFDDFHAKKDRLFRSVVMTRSAAEADGTTADGGSALVGSALVGYVFGPTALEEVPGIARYARLHPYYGDAVLTVREGGAARAFSENGVLFVDSTFLEMFSFPLVRGDRAQMLREPQTLLLSASTAQRYFGGSDPVGKTVEVTGHWATGPYTVVGVIEDVPPTSHLQFDVLLPMQDALADGRFEQSPWTWSNFTTYFELDPAADPQAVAAGLTGMYRRHNRENLAETNTVMTARLQPLTAIHLDGSVQVPASGSDRRTVQFFALVGLITLLIALVNYVNLATARAADRAKEVGVRKSVGARRGQLIGQFLLESALLNALALAVAVVLALTLLPVVNRVAGVAMSPGLWQDGRFWIGALGVFGVGTLLAGVYPAFMLSSFKPVTALKGTRRAFASGGGLRKVLVVSQFAVSIALLAGTVVVYAQLGYMRALDTGLDLDRVLVVDGPRVRTGDGAERTAEMAAFKNELRALPAVHAVGSSSATPGRGFDWYTTMRRATADPSAVEPVRGVRAGARFADVYGLELAAGEAFYEGFVAPDSGARPVVVNEALVRALGFASSDEAVGELLTIDGEASFLVRGVFEDFRWSSAHQEAEAVFFMYGPREGHISLKVDGADLPATIAAVREHYEAVFPGNPFTYHFADAAFDAQYRSDEQFATLFGAFTGIALFIACLGLFGLASFVVARRTKEIGVRKVLGASVPGIAALVSRDFLVLVGVAFLIAAPGAYLYLSDWLGGFAYQITLGPSLFLGTGAAALAIALLTVSVQSVRAATANPVDSLRYE